jgi:hypothetical protein
MKFKRFRDSRKTISNSIRIGLNLYGYLVDFLQSLMAGNRFSTNLRDFGAKIEKVSNYVQDTYEDSHFKRKIAKSISLYVSLIRSVLIHTES